MNSSRQKILSLSGCLLTLLFAFSARAEDPVAVAQREFLAGHFQAAVIAAKDAIKAHVGDESTVTAMTTLAEVAFRQAGEKKIIPDWTLPDGVTNIMAAYKRTTWEDNGSTGAFWFLVFAKSEDTVQSVKLTRVPGEAIIDSTKGIAQSGMETRTNGFLHWSTADLGTGAPRAGLYEFEIALKGHAEPFRGWFLWTGVVDGAPEITEPARADSVLSAEPTIAWKEFTFPGESPDEQRFVYINVAAHDESCKDVSVFDYLQKDPQGSLKIGDPKVTETYDCKTMDYRAVYARIANGTNMTAGAKSLKDGRYILNVKMGRVREFGPMLISRYAIRSRAFSVGTQPSASVDCDKE